MTTKHSLSHVDIFHSIRVRILACVVCKMSKRYCSILNCENNKGIFDKNVIFFRLPSDSNKKIRWIESIKTNQVFDEDCPNTKFYVCEKHFGANEIKRGGARNKLAEDAVPVMPIHPTERYFIFNFR